MHKENFEINAALRTVELLKQYKSAKNQAEQESILKQMDEVDAFASKMVLKMPTDELIEKIMKAISLDEFRPKNLPILLLAMNKDLDNIKGEFDTFNFDLSKAFKNNEPHEKIRDKFAAATASVYNLKKKFAAEWIQRLNNHKDLVNAARNASESDMLDAYNKLFDALTKDFCKEYDCIIDVKVVPNWEMSDTKPDGGYETGLQVPMYSIRLPVNISEAEQNKRIEEFSKNPKRYPGAFKTSAVRVSIANAKEACPESEDFFVYMVGVLAHEVHHALDSQNPRRGALGPQVALVDSKIYVPHSIDKVQYSKSATEISSYEIEAELKNRLRKHRF